MTGQNRIGNIAVADLYRVAVLDELRHIPPNLLRDSILRHLMVCKNRLIVGNEKIDVLQMDKTVTMHARHLCIDLCNHQPGVVNRRLGDIDADP